MVIESPSCVMSSCASSAERIPAISEFSTSIAREEADSPLEPPAPDSLVPVQQPLAATFVCIVQPIARDRLDDGLEKGMAELTDNFSKAAVAGELTFEQHNGQVFDVPLPTCTNPFGFAGVSPVSVFRPTTPSLPTHATSMPLLPGNTRASSRSEAGPSLHADPPCAASDANAGSRDAAVPPAAYWPTAASCRSGWPRRRSDTMRIFR